MPKLSLHDAISFIWGEGGGLFADILIIIKKKRNPKILTSVNGVKLWWGRKKRKLATLLFSTAPEAESASDFHGQQRRRHAGLVKGQRPLKHMI